MKYEKSCGAIVFRNNQEDYEFLLIKHRKGGHWGFPKGHVEEGETERQTALREVYEETGLSVELLNGFREEEQYSPRTNMLKTVVYFLAEAMSQDIVYILPEVEIHTWSNIHESHSQLIYESQKRLLTKAHKYLVERNYGLYKNSTF